MRTFGHVGAVAQHERQRPADGHSMPADGRRKVIAALTGQGWTSTAIAEALGISQVVIDADICDLQAAPVRLRDEVPVKLIGKSHTIALLEAFFSAPADGLTAQEAATIAGVDRYAASKRVPDLRAKGYIQRLVNDAGRVYRAYSHVYVITDSGRARVTRNLLTAM